MEYLEFDIILSKLRKWSQGTVIISYFVINLSLRAYQQYD